ncbi:MAG: hypothetical protein Q4B26_17765, partial [Eubacteriales bacterium]|nr:hypothetical protein [Eubacteriales bacterium]
MGILTYNDLITNQEFRNYVEHRLASRPEKKVYSFGVISRLYKYRALSEYAVEDIVNNQLTASNVSEFNDI